MQKSQTLEIECKITNVINQKGNYEKLLSNVYQSIRQKEFYLRKTHIGSPLIDQNIESFPKLITKDFLMKEYFAAEKDKTIKNTLNTVSANQVKPKPNLYRNLKVLEDQQKLISKENMMLLGLNVQKISYSHKNKKSFSHFLHYDHEQIESMVENQKNSLLVKEESDMNEIEENNEEVKVKNRLNRLQNKKRIQSTLKSTTIKVRERSTATTLQVRRKSLRNINPQYQNPIYEARILSYREFIFKMNYTYGTFANMEKYDENQGSFKIQLKYKAWIGLGNNGNLIKGLFKRRFWWHITQDKNYNLNFIWTQLKNNDYFKKQQPAQLWFLEKNNKNINQIEYKDNEEAVVNRERKERKKKQQTNKEDAFLYKIMTAQENQQYVKLSKMLRNKNYVEKKSLLGLNEITSQNCKMHNHLTNNFYLGNKKALFYNLKQYYQLVGGNLFLTIPLTFHIKKGNKDPQYKRFVAYHRKRQNFIKKQEKELENGQKITKSMRNIWIVKPGQLTNRGNGITVIDEIYELDSIMKCEKKHENGSQKTFIVQLYIDRPFLYKKRKFDIRHYMMISQIHGVFKAYWYNEGYIRTASYEFNVFDFERQIHLTNDAIQKYTPLYGRYEPANKLSYLEFQKYLEKEYPKQKYDFYQQVLPRMKEICLDAVKSSFVKISPERLKHNFQIFGMDFMIDNQFKPWLIEINTNPCLQLACPLLSRLIPQMLDQALRLTVDVIYPPPCHYPNTSKHLVPDASLENQKFELIFNEKVDGQELRTIYKKSKHNLLEEIGSISDDEVYEDEGKDVALQEIL